MRALRVQWMCSACAVPSGPGRPHLRQPHAVDDTLREAQRADGADGRGHLCGAHVLALVPKGVAQSVDEVDEALAVRAHEVTRAEPAVTSLEHVAHKLAARRRGVRVPGKVARRVALVDEAEQLARLAAAQSKSSTCSSRRDSSTS